MSNQPSRVNRGPAAAAANRQAILDSARRLFAERGYHVALSAIAQDAGVGQGVLYRHFRSRLELALAVFEESFAELEAVAGESGPHAFGRLWTRLIELTIETAAFVEMAVDARRSMPEYAGQQRLRSLVEATLPAAQAAGLVEAQISVDDVLLAHRMVYGVVVTTPDPADVERAAREAQAFLHRHAGL